MHSRYVVLTWQSQPRSKRIRERTPTPSPRKGLPTIEEGSDNYLDEFAVSPEETFGAGSTQSPARSVAPLAPLIVEPKEQDYKNLAALGDHRLIASVIHRYMTSKVWPPNDVIADRQREFVLPEFLLQAFAVSRTSQSDGATADKAETVEHKDAEDVPMDAQDAKPEDDCAVANTPKDHHPVITDLPRAQDLDATFNAEAHADAPEPSLERPTKKCRRSPVATELVPSEASVAESSTVAVARAPTFSTAVDKADIVEPKETWTEDVPMEVEDVRPEASPAVPDAPRSGRPSPMPQAQDLDAAPMTEDHGDAPVLADPSLGLPMERRERGAVATESAQSEALAESSTVAVARAPEEFSAAVDNAETGEPKEPQDVPMDVEDAQPEEGPAVADETADDHPPIQTDLPQAQELEAAPMAHGHEEAPAPLAPPAPSLGRPTNRRRKGAAAKEPAPSDARVAESSTRRVTRSRSAANIAANAVAVVAPAPAPAVPPAPSNVPIAPAAVQASTTTRLTRSKTGKLPPPKNPAKAPAPARQPTRRVTSKRSAPVAQPAAGAQPRRRGAAAAARTAGTQTQATGTRTRSRRS